MPRVPSGSGPVGTGPGPGGPGGASRGENAPVPPSASRGRGTVRGPARSCVAPVTPTHAGSRTRGRTSHDHARSGAHDTRAPRRRRRKVPTRHRGPHARSRDAPAPCRIARDVRTTRNGHTRDRPGNPHPPLSDGPRSPPPPRSTGRAPPAWPRTGLASPWTRRRPFLATIRPPGAPTLVLGHPGPSGLPSRGRTHAGENCARAGKTPTHRDVTARPMRVVPLPGCATHRRSGRGFRRSGGGRPTRECSVGWGLRDFGEKIRGNFS